MLKNGNVRFVHYSCLQGSISDQQDKIEDNIYGSFSKVSYRKYIKSEYMLLSWNLTKECHHIMSDVAHHKKTHPLGALGIGAECPRFLEVVNLEEK